MRKVIGIISITVLAAVGMLGIAAQGALAGEPQGADDCTPGSNPGLYHGWIQTTETTELTVTGIKGGVVLCGNNDEQQGVGYKEGFIRTTGLHQRIGNPDKYGMELRCANPDHDRAGDNVCGGVGDDLEATSYIGSSGFDLLVWKFGSDFRENVSSNTYVDHAQNEPDRTCPAYEDPDGSGPWPEGPVVQCLLGAPVAPGVPIIGWSVITVVKIASGTGAGANTGQYIYHMHEPTSSVPFVDLYYAKFGSRGKWNETLKQWYKDPEDDDLELTTCKYAGVVGGGDQCSDNDPNRWLQKTGLASMYTDVVGTLVGPAPFQFRGLFFNGSQYQKKNVNIRQKWTQ